MAERTFEWDDQKRAANLAKHGLDFADAASFGWNEAAILEDARRDYGERRLRAYGRLGGVPCVIVFTLRGEATARIISFRRVRTRELQRHGL